MLKRVALERMEKKPPHHGAIDVAAGDDRLMTHYGVSRDNGATWDAAAPTPDYCDGLPFGYRRDPYSWVVDPASGRVLCIINALDTPGLDPTIVEPPLALYTYYLRYRVSIDQGRTWLFDERMIHDGDYTAELPFNGFHIGKNGFFLGDIGCIPIVTQTGRVLIAFNGMILGDDGELYNPTDQTTYSEVFVVSGQWKADHRLAWRMSDAIKVDITESTRGMIEPTLLETNDGRVMMVMRGSNAGAPDMLACKWLSISNDDGDTWSQPKPWTYDDGQPFYSPSSMSVLMKHSSGRMFWAGNLSPSNALGNNPRHPMVIGEVDGNSLSLLRDSVLVIDDLDEADRARVRTDLSHVYLREDRRTGEIHVTYPRSYDGYVTEEWVAARVQI